MKTEAKELIQEGLKLFSLYDRRALKRFYLSAEKSEADLSYLDEKYQTHMRSKARELFFDFLGGIIEGIASSGSPFSHSLCIDIKHLLQKYIKKNISFLM